MSSYPHKHVQQDGFSLLIEYLTNFCIVFTVSTLFFFLPLLYIFGGAQVQSSIIYMLQVVGIGLISTIMQLIFFSHVILNKFSYHVRLTLFGICNYAALALYAWIAQIFPVDDLSGWVTFSAIYIAIFILMTIIFGGLYHFKEKKLNEQLSRFKEAHKE